VNLGDLLFYVLGRCFGTLLAWAKSWYPSRMTPSTTIFGFDAATVQTFDAAYNAWLPPAVRALMTMDPTQPARQAEAYTLAGQGYFIDVPIMVWGWDPYMVMYQRQIDGYETYPDALQAQSKKTSTNPADYPPYAAPVTTGVVLVGAQIGQSPFFFLTQAAASMNPPLPSGDTVEQDGHTYTLQYIQQQSGSSTQWIGRWLQIS
jgi:hypothetical protein